MRRTLSALLVGAAFVALAGATAPPTDAVAGRAAPVTTHTQVVSGARNFTASGTLGRYYTKQTVTGTYKNAKGRPVNVTVFNWQGVALVTSARPKLDPAWWGNYWHDTYGLDQWYVGTIGGDTFHFMLPPPPMGSTFTALLVTEFGGGGNWQNWMDGTSS